MRFYRLILVLAFVFGISEAYSQLRIRKVHETQKGETLNSISAEYGVTIEDLISVNPDISKQPNKKFKSGYLINIPDVGIVGVESNDTLNLAVVLPFTTQGKEGQRCIEFYRGLLMSADEERQKGRCIKIMALDEPVANNDLTHVIAQLNQDVPDVIVGPLYPTHFSELSTFVRDSGVNTIIPFSSKVKEVDENPYLFLLNTPNEMNIHNGFTLFKSVFEHSRCVIIRTTDASKTVLVNSWMDKMIEQGYEVQTLSQDFEFQDLKQSLNPSELNVLLLDGTNSQQVLNILKKVNSFAEQLNGYQLAVVGYSEWQQFSMEYNDLLCALNTYLLSQDFYNAYDKNVISFEEKYYTSFKEYPLLINPRMGELGYDTGCYILTLNGKLQNPDNELYNVNFLQSRFEFEKVGAGGFINSNLMFIHYAPNYKIELIELKK